MKLIKKVWSILDRKQKRGMIWLGILILIAGLFECLSVSAIIPVAGVIVDVNLVAQKIEEFGLPASFSEWLLTTDYTTVIVAFVIATILVFVVKNLFLLFQTYQQNKYIAYNRNDMITRVLREFLNRPYEFYLDADIPTVFRMTDSDIPQVFALLLCLVQLLTEFVVAVGIGLFLFITYFWPTLFLLVVLGGLSGLLIVFMKPGLKKLGEKNLNLQSRIARWRIQAIYGIKDVKVLNREEFFAHNYETSGIVGADIACRYAVVNSLPKLVIETIFIIGILALLLLQYLGGNNMNELIIELGVFAVAGVRLMPCMNRITNYINQIAYLEPCLDFLCENMDMEKIARCEKPRDYSDVPEIAVNECICLNHITYKYPNTEKYIFEDAQMTVPRGKSVGIIGTSGAGKSTIVDILLGLLSPEKGEITADGRNINENYPSWLHRIGYIPQSIYLVDEPIRVNIAFGIEPSEIDDERIWQVLEDAQLADFIRSLPDGLDTEIGENGVRISGGQRQRLGIARALYHNPEILVFDEATSALDNETEAALMEAINGFHGKKTMIIIAHRLNTIEKCDIVYRVEGGKITVDRDNS